MAIKARPLKSQTVRTNSYRVSKTTGLAHRYSNGYQPAWILNVIQLVPAFPMALYHTPSVANEEGYKRSEGPVLEIELLNFTGK